MQNNPPLRRAAPHPTPQILLRLLRLIAPFGWWIALATLLGCATIGSSIGLMATSAYLIAKAALMPSIAELQVAIVGVRFFGIARGLFRYSERMVTHKTTFQLLARLRVWFYQAAEPLAPAGLLGYRSGDLLSRIMSDIDTLEHFYVQVIAPPLVALLVAALACALLGSFSIGLGLLLLLFLLLAGVGVPLLIARLSRRPGAEIIAIRAELNALLVDGVQGMADLLAFGAEARYRAEVDQLSERLAKAQERMAFIRGLHSALGGLLASLASLAVLTLGITLVQQGQLDGVYLALLTLTTISCFEAVTPLALAAQQLESSLAAARRLFALVDQPPAVSDRPNAQAAPRMGDLVVEHLSFAYPADPDAPAERPALALDDLSLTVPQGARVALVGPSGAGKSTLVQLLLRFWDYEHGQICLGGRDLREHRAEDMRDMIAVVAQHTDLFNGTIRENLQIARPDASMEQIVAAARQAQIDGLIQRLPQGYDTWVGEQGLRLSGGERQRIAIARAILRDAPILILDEATAQLDQATAQATLRSLEELMAGRTTLIISHQLTQIASADHIAVLQGGRLLAQGRHADLLGSCELYRRMWEYQASELGA